MRIFFYLTIATLFGSCAGDSVKKSRADILLDKGIEAAGGWQNWMDLDTIQFYKMTKLYLEDGSLEDSTYQLHTYYMYPEMNGKYSWKEEQTEYEIRYHNGSINKYSDGKEINISDEEKEKYRLSFLGAQFTMSMPFKLKDPGVIIGLAGINTINGKEVEVLNASYNSNLYNHTDSHDWWYYFDRESGEQIGYKVHHSPTFARVINVETIKLNGIRFPKYRKSYRVDKDDNELYLRAEFWYSFIE